MNFGFNCLAQALAFGDEHANGDFSFILNDIRYQYKLRRDCHTNEIRGVVCEIGIS